MTPAPSLVEWIGGPARLRELMTLFYSRVPADPVLGPVFARMPAEHADHVAAFVAEVFGGPKEYSGRHGGHRAMVLKHANHGLTEPQRQRWMSLLLACADEAGLPADPEFRSALVGYLEWGSRLAVINSQPGVAAPSEAPMPVWGWGETGGPYNAG